VRAATGMDDGVVVATVRAGSGPDAVAVVVDCKVPLHGCGTEDSGCAMEDSDCDSGLAFKGGELVGVEVVDDDETHLKKLHTPPGTCGLGVEHYKGGSQLLLHNLWTGNAPRQIAGPCYALTALPERQVLACSPCKTTS
jgi:hypothetical protein